MKHTLKVLSLALAAAFAGNALAGDAPANPRINVWPGVAPGSESWTQEETDTKFPGAHMVRNVVKPSLEVFAPEAGKANGTAVIIAPGGAFRFLSIESEGVQVAQWFNSKGVTAFVLRYRLAETPSSDLMFATKIMGIVKPLFEPGEALLNDMKTYAPPAIADGKQALKLLRERAAEFKINPKRIGFLGFSAGGAVATGVSIDYTPASRPDFTIAVYPGPWPIAKVPADAPPLFATAAVDDSITTRGYQPLVDAWKAAKRPVEAKLYETGGHGFGLKKQDKPSDAWADALSAWLDAQGLLKPTAP